MLSKHSFATYNDRVVSLETWVPCEITGVHLDDGPEDPYYTIRFNRGEESMEKQTQPDRLRAPPAAHLSVKVVYIKNLLNHLGKGWSEEALATGKVSVLGKDEAVFDFTPEEVATVEKLAGRVEDEWGTARVDQSYRFAGRSILPSTRADGELDLRTLRSSSITDELVLLMSAGKPGDQQRAGPGEGGGLATMERSAGSATMQETDESGEGGGAKRNTAAASSSSFEETPGQRLGGGIAAAAETAALSAAERRKLQADAAARRFGA